MDYSHILEQLRAEQARIARRIRAYEALHGCRHLPRCRVKGSGAIKPVSSSEGTIKARAAHIR